MEMFPSVLLRKMEHTHSIFIFCVDLSDVPCYGICEMLRMMTIVGKNICSHLFFFFFRDSTVLSSVL